MSTVLSNGVIVPDVGSTNWASDLETNWTLLNALIGAVGANVRLDRPNIWTAAQTFSEGIYGDLDGTAAMAVSDANGNEIATTYALKTSVTSLQTAVTDLQTAVASKAADDQVVHLAGAETISGNKTHDADLGITGNHLFAWDRPQVTIGTNPASVTYWGTERYRDSGGSSFCLRRGYVGTAGDLGLWEYVYAWSTPSEIAATRLSIGADGSGSAYTVRVKAFRPYATNQTDCGTSEYKFATFNGINPGALSLPSNSAYVDILSSITHTDWIVNYYTPAINGYIALHVNGCAIIQPYGTYGISAGFYDGTIRINDLRVCLPVIANQTYEIWVLGTVNEARLFACLGNV